MDYFCYISQTKVDQLLGNLQPTVADSWTEANTTATESAKTIGAGLSLGGVFNLFKGDASYGRKGSIQIGREVKRRYLDKLQQVLEAVAVEPGILPLDSVNKRLEWPSLYYHYIGDFRTAEAITEGRLSTTATLVSDLAASQQLSLDCSLRFFSESNTPQGEFLLHSTNMRFFSGEIPLRFETVFMLLHSSDASVFGTPLFLKLHGQQAGAYVVL